MRSLEPVQKLISKSATRALDVLELFGREQTSLCAKQIRDALHISPSSTDLLLKTMAYSGYIIFDPLSKKYDPSPRLLEFSSFIKDRLYVKHEHVSNILSELRDRTGAIATLTLRNGDFMCVVDAETVDGSDIGLAMEKGYSFDGISGKTLFSAFEERETVRILDRAERYRHISSSWRSTLLPAIREIGARGFAFGETVSPAYWAVAVPVSLGSPDHRRLAVISASGTKDYICSRRDAIIDVTNALTRNLSAI